ncbi:Ribonuclease II/R [Macleaya cordata]|uniref:DIS3-like exonuclease 2 n=1 Tax=Macleaya cordata TaxID=56857 RepID=A0A200PM99_MACCD|nr:Ribonuclease II/R [Macleaya cordata]
MRGVTEQFVVERTEEGDKEKKKKRRSNRRSKHNSSAGADHSAVNGVHGESSACLTNGNASNYATVSMNSSSSQMCRLNFHVSNDRGLARASDVAFRSLPTMRINDQVAEFRSMQDQSQFPSILEGTVFSKSCPVPIIHEETNELFRDEEFLSPHKNGIPSGNHKKIFLPHLSAQAVNEAIEKGEVSRASFRVNAHNPAEAYCTIDGVPIDILINGVLAQNRAVEGDTIAVKLDPLAYWTRLKGSAGHVNSSVPTDDSNMPREVVEVVGTNYKGKEKLDPDWECAFNKTDLLPAERGFRHEGRSSTGVVHPELGIVYGSYKHGSEGHHSSSSDLLNVGHSPEHKEVSNAIGRICAMVNSYPLKRPTGRVVAIVDRSPRRDSVVGFLGVKQWLSYRDGYKRERKKNSSSISFADGEYIQLSPNDAKFPKMLVSVRSLPDCIKMRLEKGDATVEMELVAARIDDWSEASPLPLAQVVHALGRGGEIGSQIAAILFENAICSSEFSPKSLSCLPGLPWEVPKEEVERRKDLRNLCTFTIDPSTATDLDDALSVERISDDIFRVGVHISDVSYFVLPGTALDIEAQKRSTSVYLPQRKFPMLPPLLSEDVGSLIPGVDKLAFSIICDINLAGDVVDRWLGHTVVHSCCKLSYQHAQDIIDGLIDADTLSTSGSGYPKLYGQFEWKHIARSIKSLHEISKRLKENRFKDGALRLDSSELVFAFDECGIPQDSRFFEQTDSNSLVEELMLLANRTAAEVISRAFPDSALLRRHPEPNLRKLREFEAFCLKHGLESDTSSSGQLQLSLERIKEKLKNDPVLFDILISFASKPMQLAAYFCTGDFKDRRSDWTHYSLAIPHYTHFTSPLRRYPDIVVHRTLAAAIEAEDMYLQRHRTLAEANKGQAIARKCFTGIYFDEDIVDTKECREALSAAALKHRVLCAEGLTEVAAYCNKRMMASKHAEDACDKLYLWAMLKKKQTLVTEARVLGLGPKFMSIYIHKLAIERRIYYDEVDGLMTEWLETTSTLVLNLCTNKHSHRRSSPGRYRSLEDVAWIIIPCDLKQEVVSENSHEVGRVQLTGEDDTAIKSNDPEISDANEIEPAFLPLTVRLLSTINVALHAVGGDDGPLDIGAKLYLSSYLR